MKFLSSSLPAALLALAIALTLIAPHANAAKVKSWQHASKADFEKGRADGVVISRDGELSLGRRLEEVADLETSLVSALVRLPDGPLYVATALPGSVVRLDDEGERDVMWKPEEQQAFSLALLPDGGLVVGTGPNGAVWKIPTEGEPSEWFSTGAMYVWDVIADDEGNVYAATGPGGKIFRIDPDGKGRVFYETNQEHVLCLARLKNDTLVAGTDGSGLVLAIDSAGNGRALYDAEEDEVRSLWVGDDGVIYAGTAKGATSGATSDSGSSSRSGSGKQNTNSVYRIEPSGAVRKVLGVDALVYSLAQLGDGTMLAGTGSEGFLYTLDEDGRGERELARLDTELLLAMLPEPDGTLLVATGNPGKLYRVSSDYVSEGTLTSPPLDATLVARFGSLTWRGHAPSGTGVALAVRSGNTSTPDETWSGWSIDSTDPATARADCPPGRFLQYRLTLRSSDPAETPNVRSISVRYLTANQPPVITRLEVPHVEDGDGSKRLDKLKITWAANDPNGDALRYTLRCKKPQWQTWVTLAEPISGSDYEWDITSMPEGTYLVQLEVDDHQNNPPTDALSASMTSAPFVVDRSGPVVEARLAGVGADRQATFEVGAEDQYSPIVGASYSIDSGAWTNIFPEDRLFDAPVEQFRFTVTDLKPGTHVLVVRATDAAGYVGSADLVFEVASGNETVQAAPVVE